MSSKRTDPGGAGAPVKLDLERCESLAARSAAGDGEAWRELVEHLWPVWLRMLRASRTLGHYARREEHVHDVIQRLVEKLGKDGGRGLSLYAGWRERHPDKRFDDWMRIVVANAARDHLRERLGHGAAAAARRAGGSDPAVKQLLDEFASSAGLERLGWRPALTAEQTARQLLEFAETRLPRDQRRSLLLWLRGAEFDEIAAELGLGDGEAGRKLVRAAVAVLRRHFVDGAPPGREPPGE